MSYKVCIFSLLSVFLISLGVILGFAYHEEREREREREAFIVLFPRWFHTRLLCAPSLENDRSLLSLIFPELIRRIDAENAKINTILSRNRDEDMSVGDMLNLKDTHNKKINGHRLKFVDECDIEGFIFTSRTRELRYCENNVSVSLLNPDLLGSFLNHSQGRLLVRSFYSNLKETNNVTNFLNKMQVANASKFERFEEYSRMFDQLPASQFSGLTRSEIEAAKEKYKLERDIDFQCSRDNTN